MSWANLLKTSKKDIEKQDEHIFTKNQMGKQMEILSKSTLTNPNQKLIEKAMKLPIFQYIQDCHFSPGLCRFSRYQYQQLRLLYKKLIIPHCSKHNIMDVKFEDFIYFAKNYKNPNIYKVINNESILDNNSSLFFSNLSDKQIIHLYSIIDPYDKADMLIKFLQINGDLQSDELEKLVNNPQSNIQLISELNEIDIHYELQCIVLQIHDHCQYIDLFETLHTGQLYTFLHKSK